MNIAILNFDYAVMSSVIGPYDILSKTNAFLDSFYPGNAYPRLNVKVLQTNKALITNPNESELPGIMSMEYIRENEIFDFVIIPAMDFDKIPHVLKNEANTIDWLKWQYAEGAEIASICLGAFLLASTGLLDGKTATTHWLGAKPFREMFSAVTLLDDKIIVDHNRIYSSGGAFSFTSLMIYLIEKFFDHRAAMLVSKVFMIHIHDTRQTSYSIFHQQKAHGDPDMSIVQGYIESHYKDSISNEKLASLINFSNRTLARRFKKATGNTPYEYVQRIRIESAKKMLENIDTGVEQVALDVGYEDFSSFRKVFKRLTGITPLDYKRKYGKTFLPEYVNIS